MSRTKQTARKSTGGKAPRRQLATGKSGFRSYMTSFQQVGTVDYGSGERKSRTSFINYENTFGDHGFKASVCPEGKENFSPRWSLAKTSNPDTGATQYWASVAFASKFHGGGIRKYGRKGVDLMLICDVSGSMSCSFSGAADRAMKSKLDILKSSIKTIMKQLQPGDRLGVVTFNQGQQTLLDLTDFHAMTKGERTVLDRSIANQTAGGGTELADGFYAGVSQLFDDYDDEGSWSSPNVRRAYFLTDMESDETDEKRVLEHIRLAATKNVFTTVVGIDVDLSVGCVQNISCVTGCRYISVSCEEDALASFVREFPYDIAPIAVDINVIFKHTAVKKGFGSSELLSVKPGTREIVLSGEFASSTTTDGQVLGGILVFQIRKPVRSRKIHITTSWQSVGGENQRRQTTCELAFHPEGSDYFGNLDIRKALSLIHFVDLQEEYVNDEDTDLDDLGGLSKSAKNEKKERLSRWLKRLVRFKHMFEREMKAVGETKGRKLYIATTIDQMIDFERKDLKRLGANSKKLEKDVAADVAREYASMHSFSVDQKNENNDVKVKDEGSSSRAEMDIIPKLEAETGLISPGEPLLGQQRKGGRKRSRPKVSTPKASLKKDNMARVKIQATQRSLRRSPRLTKRASVMQ